MVFDVVVLFFLLGVFARLVKSDLRLPESLYETLSIYLLLSIGLKGGIELSKQPLMVLAPEVLSVVLMGFMIPILLYPVFRLFRLSSADSSALGAHFGSVSVVTFAVITAALARSGIAYESHAPVWVAVMEAPGIIAGVLLAKFFKDTNASKAGNSKTQWLTLAHDVFFGKSVSLCDQLGKVCR